MCNSKEAWLAYHLDALGLVEGSYTFVSRIRAEEFVKSSLAGSPNVVWYLAKTLGQITAKPMEINFKAYRD